jgi:Na+/melibiose symporter-like transporter
VTSPDDELAPSGSTPAPLPVPSNGAVEATRQEPGDGAENSIDNSRLRSFIGLSVGLVGPRANLAVSGVLITLYVQHRASSALAVTFALTASRLLSWLTYPIAGRLSDRTRSRVGRRTPYMGVSLVALGVCTWIFTVVPGYWPLVLFIVLASQAASVFTLTNVAVVPEVFGRSRWIKALLLTTVLGTLASLTIKGTVIASWKQNDPSTWNLPFQVAAAIMVAVGICVLVLVREAPAARRGAEADRGRRARPARDELRDILAGPNAKVLVAGSLLFWSGVGSTAYVAILFFQRVLHAGASAQTIAGLATGLPVFFIGIALGIPLSRWLTPMQLAIGAPLVGAVLAGVQYFDTHIWQAVALSYIAAPFIGAYIIVLAPLLLRLLPRAGGLGERLGVLVSPFNLCGVLLAYLAAAVVDATGNYRLIWLFPAVTGLAHATVNCWLKIPPRRSSSPDMVKRLWDWSVVQAESMAETGIVTGLLAAPLLGVVTEEDADSAVVVDMARDVLGNPYEEEEEGSDQAVDSKPSNGSGASPGNASGAPGSDGDGDGGGDGVPASADSEDSGTGSGTPSGDGSTRGVPDGGVASAGPTGQPPPSAIPGSPIE